jgi:Mrp family chromosome partitioning ATPase
VARTKDFSADPPTIQQDPKNKRVTQDRYAAKPQTQIRDSGARGGRTAQGQAVGGQGKVPPAGKFNPNAEARSTLIMKPGQLAGEAPAAPAPRKKYGVPSGDELRTVIMAPESNVELESPQSAMSEHPVDRNVQPPKIDLVQHQIPADAPPDSRLMMLANPDSEQAAAFRVLRHHVLDAGHPQVIAVSGPNDGCGKTTVAINLAMALAECGRAEVLLIDANLRNPKLASILRFVPPWCFAQQLEQHREQPFAPWGFVDITQLGLHVAAIDPRNDRRQRLDAPAFAIALDRLRLGPYQHIVIDCPSVIGNADVNLIQDATDGVLLAARTKHATAQDIRTAVDQLTPTKILGTALFES